MGVEAAVARFGGAGRFAPDEVVDEAPAERSQARVEVERDGVAAALMLAAGAGDEDGGGVDNEEAALRRDAVDGAKGGGEEVEVGGVGGVGGVVAGVVVGG